MKDRQRKDETIMTLLEVKNVRKIYTTRFGGNQVEALHNVNFSVEQESMSLLWESPVPVRQHFLI